MIKYSLEQLAKEKFKAIKNQDEDYLNLINDLIDNKIYGSAFNSTSYIKNFNKQVLKGDRSNMDLQTILRLKAINQAEDIIEELCNDTRIYGEQDEEDLAILNKILDYLWDIEKKLIDVK